MEALGDNSIGATTTTTRTNDGDDHFNEQNRHRPLGIGRTVVVAVEFVLEVLQLQHDAVGVGLRRDEAHPVPPVRGPQPPNEEARVEEQHHLRNTIEMQIPPRTFNGGLVLP